MGTANTYAITFPFTAGEDLHKVPQEGIAIALDDGKTANNSLEATGILLSKPKSGENGSMLMLGIGKGRAGAAITKGTRVRVTTSGYFVTAASGYYHSGRAMEAITSGSLGPIYFHGIADYQVSSK